MPALEAAAEARGEARVVQHSSAARNMGGKPLDAKYFEKSEPQSLGGDGSAACIERYHQTKLANTVRCSSASCQGFHMAIGVRNGPA